jgi:O-acetyl-ADP-ribose deacetylase (regulator of RNase III)
MGGDMKAKVNKVTIQLVQGDLLEQSTAAIAVATNTDLALSPALVDRAGANLIREVALIGYCAVGEAVITTGGASGFEKIIHVVGPRWGEGSERGKLAGATFEALRLAESNKLKSIALPAISTGAQGYPLENCAKTMITQIIDYTFEALKYLRLVVLVLADEVAFAVFKREFQQQIDELKQSGEGKVSV